MSAFDIEPPEWFYVLDSGVRQRVKLLPKWAKEKLFTLGEQGFNNNLMGVARSLSSHFGRDELLMILRPCADSYQRDVSDAELERAVDKAYDESTKVVARPRPGYDGGRVRKLVDSSRIRTVDALASAFGQEETQPENILPLLFGGDPLICVAESQKKAQTMPLSQLLQSDLSGFQFIVPSPMSKKWGTTQEGNKSARCLDNTGDRKYLVIEFDQGTQDEQAACIAHLAEFAPLILTVFSGGKSLHAWFEVRETDEATLKRFMDYAVTLGADKATWTKCQFVRMPGAMRDNGKRQSVVLFSPMAAELGAWKPERIPKVDEVKPDDFTPRHFTELPFSTEASDFVEGLLTKESVSVILGSPGAGKSFFALDLAVCVASGRDWRNREVEAGGVIYICLEGLNGFKRRIEALQRAGVLGTDDPFYLLPVPVDLLSHDHREKLCDSISLLMEQSACPVSLIVVDTLSRAMPGADENSGEAMGEMLATVDALKSRLRTHVCLVHHVGKDAKRGARGHSSLNGAIDTEITINRDEATKISTAKVTKQKDLECEGSFPFKLRSVSLGLNSKGREITSCIVEHVESESSPVRRGRKPMNTPGELLDLLPVASAGEWQKKAESVLGIPSTRFYTLRSELGKEGKFEIRPDGGIFPVSRGAEDISRNSDAH